MLLESNASSIDQRLIALLEEERGSDPAGMTASLLERLDALEVEALKTYAPGTTLVVIRVAREAVEFAERLKARSVERGRIMRSEETLRPVIERVDPPSRSGDGAR